MDVMRGLGEGEDRTPTRWRGEPHAPFHAEDWSKLPVIVSGEGCYVTDQRGNRYIDGLAGLFTTQIGHGRTELGEVAARQMKELGFFPNWSFQHPRSLELAAKTSEICRGPRLDLFVSLGLRGRRDGQGAGAAVPQGERRGDALQGHLAQDRLPRHDDGVRSRDGATLIQGAVRAAVAGPGRTFRTRSRTRRGRPTPSRRPSSSGRQRWRR